MRAQLPLLEEGATPDDSVLVTERHLNHQVSRDPGLQEVEVPGLYFFETFLSQEEQDYCVQRVDAAETEWRHDLSRRVQHYGWRYDYKSRAITPDMHLGALPDWLDDVAQKLYERTGLFDRVPEQVIVNEYQQGQGIAMHIDHPGVWTNGLHYIPAR